LTPQDPVTLGLCSQIDLDAEVKKAAKRAERDRKDGDLEKGGTLLSTTETTAPSGNTAEILAPKTHEAPEETPEQEQARVFAKLKGMTSHKEEEEEPSEGDADSAKSEEKASDKDEEKPEDKAGE
jgi:hypothetical protein